ncbi:MAG TPA: hypothetical protein VI299_00895, partial [Polyangiales bacterium]
MKRRDGFIHSVRAMVAIAAGLVGCTMGQSAVPSEQDSNGANGKVHDASLPNDPETDAALVEADSGVSAEDSGVAAVKSDAGRDAGLRGSYQEVFNQGLTRYVGTPQMQETEVTSSGSGSTKLAIHHFSGKNRGPICMYGDEYFVETREGSSDTLMIFLQGGGVCLDEICAATP